MGPRLCPRPGLVPPGDRASYWVRTRSRGPGMPGRCHDTTVVAAGCDLPDRAWLLEEAVWPYCA